MKLPTKNKSCGPCEGKDAAEIVVLSDLEKSAVHCVRRFCPQAPRKYTLKVMSQCLQTVSTKGTVPLPAS
jgi:hypothetical protein